MKFRVCIAFVLFSTTAVADELRIFNKEIDLRPDCSIRIKYPDGAVETRALPFRNKEKCIVHQVSETNVPRVEFVKGSYVLLIESQNQVGNDCRAELAAVVVSPSGRVKTGSKTQKTGACSYGERKDFEILHFDATK